MFTRELSLPADFHERAEAGNPAKEHDQHREIVSQSEIYPLALRLLTGTGRQRLVEIDCGDGSKLVDAPVGAKLSANCGKNIAHCRNNHFGSAEWLEWDPGTEAPGFIVDSIGQADVVVCSRVIEHLPDPRPLLAFLRQCFQRGALVLTSTPGRALECGDEHRGAPPDAAHIRGWTAAEYASLLLASNVPPLYLGITLNDSSNQALGTIVSIHEPLLQKNDQAVPPKPLAIMSCFNEEDVIGEVIEHWMAQGCDVHVLDNWSTDQSCSILAAAAARHGNRLVVERFPLAEPSQSSWRDILARKEDIAACHPGRWIIHTDADEVRESSFAPFNLAAAMQRVASAGWNRINFTVLNHRAVNNAPFVPGSLSSALPYFEYGTKPGHFVQKKAWLQGPQKVRLAESGGHVAEFDNARDCPYHFVLHHYPLRSVEHGRRKINQERMSRWSAAEIARGWHSQYAEFTGDAGLVWDANTLHDVRVDFWPGHGLHILTGLPR